MHGLVFTATVGYYFARSAATQAVLLLADCTASTKLGGDVVGTGLVILVQAIVAVVFAVTRHGFAFRSESVWGRGSKVFVRDGMEVTGGVVCYCFGAAPLCLQVRRM